MIVRWETDHDYVLVHIHQDMFGDWIFSRAWGQIGTQFGGLKHQLADSLEQAQMWLEDEATIQSSRGFRKVLEAAAHPPAGQAANVKPHIPTFRTWPQLFSPISTPARRPCCPPKHTEHETSTKRWTNGVVLL